MLISRSLLATFALSLFASPLLAQKNASQPVPDAPLPSAPSSTKPILAIPTPTYEVPKSHASQLPDNTVCHAPAEGLFAKSNDNKKFPPALQGVVNSYIRNAMAQINDQWSHHMSLGERNAWAHEKHLSLRFVIYPDGTHSAPEVTISSNHPNDDEHAINAVKNVPQFDPLPTGVTRPIPICINFGYSPKDWEQGPPDPLLKPPSETK